jgi:peptidoglycan lytic transglycosylase G
LRKAVLVLVIAVVAIGLAGYFHFKSEIDAGPPGRPVTVSIPQGTSTAGIAHVLAKAKVIHSPTLFEIYTKVVGTKPLLAGTYRLPTNESYGKVIAALQKGPVMKELVVPEGFTVAEIARAVGGLQVGIDTRAFLRAVDEVRSPYEPAGKDNLEGLLYPATYPVTYGESAVALVRYMVSTFDYHAAQAGLASAAQKLGFSPYQVVTVASIVEREAKEEADRGPIASAIYNRLARGMPVGAESTLLYGLGKGLPFQGTLDLTDPNPYNTFVNKGLPPTPIASPGDPSLLAAMHPPKTPYIYWVEVNPDGKMGFGSTNAQFVQLQRKCKAAQLC